MSRRPRRTALSRIGFLSASPTMVRFGFTFGGRVSRASASLPAPRSIRPIRVRFGGLVSRASARRPAPRSIRPAPRTLGGLVSSASASLPAPRSTTPAPRTFLTGFPTTRPAGALGKLVSKASAIRPAPRSIAPAPARRRPIAALRRATRLPRFASSAFSIRSPTF